MRSTFSTTLDTLRRRKEIRLQREGEPRVMPEPTAQERAWLERSAKRAAAREARLNAMRAACGPKPTAAIEAAIKQIQNRAEHSR
jgi:hypothetical protein